MIEWLRTKGDVLRRDAGPSQSSDPAMIELPSGAIPLVIKRHHSARRMTLRLAPDGSEARVTIPRFGSIAEAHAFARSRSAWLESQLAKVPAPQTIGADSVIQFRGRSAQVVWSPDAPRKVQLEEGADGALFLRAGGPEDTLPKRIERWLRTEALSLMTDDLAFYCAAINRPPPPIGLSRAQRRWGSCSSKGMVRINWRLIQAPDNVRRSVVAHEVAHLVHFDHSRAFHSLLDQIFDGDLMAAERWLKREGRTLYAAFG